MGYPFYDNPLDEYLFKLFDLQVREFEANCIKLDKASTLEAKKAAGESTTALYEEIRALKWEHELPERTFDRFRSPAELAAERFEREHPEPPKLNVFNCQHVNATPTKRVFRNGAMHVVLQCRDCGTQPRSLPKSDYDLKTLPDFDEGLYHRLTAERSLWEEARWAVYKAEMQSGNDIPDYDYTSFDETFRKLNPAPCRENCAHEHLDARLRTYSTGGNAIALQCITCGHHVSTSSKSKYPGWATLTPFDQDLVKRSTEEYNAWLQHRFESSKIDHKNYKNSVRQRLQQGELTWRDNSRFGTYYDSPEWERTRARIIRRDDYQCQACKCSAECVHHILYDRLGAENDYDLISLCHNCHNVIHKEQRKTHNLYRMSPSAIRLMHTEDDK
ncbi:HNH endonuclease [Pseudomonas sp. R3-56]|uniref:HNH endonuclease n=1 Tax=Pseudomonas sp. R3-56 TaxID=2817401 RepID=UPI003DA8FA22